MSNCPASSVPKNLNGTDRPEDHAPGSQQRYPPPSAAKAVEAKDDADQQRKDRYSRAEQGGIDGGGEREALHKEQLIADDTEQTIESQPR